KPRPAVKECTGKATSTGHQDRHAEVCLRKHLRRFSPLACVLPVYRPLSQQVRFSKASLPISQGYSILQSCLLLGVLAKLSRSQPTQQQRPLTQPPQFRLCLQSLTT